MRFRQLEKWAEAVVAATRSGLPEDVRKAVEAVTVHYEEAPDASVLGEGFEPDLLGLFQGTAHGDAIADSDPRPPQILLYLPCLWDCAEKDPAAFKEEVRLTFLHELGHYLGWDEGQVAERGLA